MPFVEDDDMIEKIAPAAPLTLRDPVLPRASECWATQKLVGCLVTLK